MLTGNKIHSGERSRMKIGRFYIIDAEWNNKEMIEFMLQKGQFDFQYSQKAELLTCSMTGRNSLGSNLRKSSCLSVQNFSPRVRGHPEMQHRVSTLYPAKISLNNAGEAQTFPNIRKQRIYH